MIRQYEVYRVSLDPTMGHEIRKSRPCVVVSPNEMNQYLGTVIVAPMTTKSHDYPTRVYLHFKGKSGWIVLDQLRTVDKRRLTQMMGELSEHTARQIKSVIREMFL